MQAGVIGVVDGDFQVVDSFADTIEENDRDLSRCLDVQRVFSLPSGGTAFAGRAARERVRTDETHEITDGEIRVREDPRTETRYTEFVGVPGEFVVVASGSGGFAFDLVAADTNTGIERATLDLDGFFADHGDARPWKAGFRGQSEDAVTGVFHGDDLRASHDLDDLLASATLTQVGLAYDYDDAACRMTASRSGYVELYEPRDFDAGDYLDYLRDEIIPHVE